MVKGFVFSRVLKKALFLLCAVFFFNVSVFAVEFELSPGFSYQEIPSDIQKFMTDGGSYKENEYIKFEDLRLCKVKHIGFDEKEYDGELVVAYEVKNPVTGEVVNVSKEVLEIFKDLYDAKYPIKQIRLIDYYDANDEQSMQDIPI